MYTVGKLSKQFKLSRSALLYYDKIGLLKPSARSDSNYRLYSETDVETLRQIIRHREAGISLEDIASLLDVEKTDVTAILSKRLEKIHEEISVLRKQEDMILSVLIQIATDSEVFNRKSWSDLLSKLGYDHYEWHQNFEETSSEEHSKFLKTLGFSDEDIRALRQKFKE